MVIGNRKHTDRIQVLSNWAKEAELRIDIFKPGYHVCVPALSSSHLVFGFHLLCVEFFFSMFI